MDAAPLQSPASQTNPSAPPYGLLFVLFAASRGLIYLIAALSLAGVAKPADFRPPAGILDWFIRWDATWYLDIAAHGYHLNPAGTAPNTGFFPFYPWLVRVASVGGVVDLRVAGYAVSLVGLWLACVWLWRLIEREWRDPHLATVGVTLLLFGPVSFFLTTVYSESWFIPLTIGSLAAARRRHWIAAGALGAFAALTRLAGVLLVIAIVWEAFINVEKRRLEWPGWRGVVGCLLPAVGLLAWCLWLYTRFGDPLLYFHTQSQYWGRHFSWFWGLFARPSFSDQPVFYQYWFGGATVVTFALLLAGVWLRMPVSFSLYALAGIGIYLSARFSDSLPRYFSGLFPLYIAGALAARRWRVIEIPLICFSVALLALSVTLFVNGYWFT